MDGVAKPIDTRWNRVTSGVKRIASSGRLPERLRVLELGGGGGGDRGAAWWGK